MIPAISFIHIPIPEFLDVWNQKETFGQKNELVCCSVKNTGLFSAILEQKNIKGIFVGHDHKNDYSGDLDGVMLGYGRKTGYGGYQPPPDMLRYSFELTKRSKSH